jgi:hypothetical protein
MEGIKEKAAVKRVLAALHEHGLEGEVHVLSDSARTAQEAASALGIEVGQIASSLIFKLPDETPLLIITSGRHRVDTDLVAKNLGIEKLGRVDADYVKDKSGFSIGGVPLTAYVSRKIYAGLASLPLEKLLLSLRGFAASLSCRSVRSTAFVSSGN